MVESSRWRVLGKELWRVFYGDDSTISRIVTGHGLLFVNRGGPPGPRGAQLWAVRQGGKGEVTDSHVVWKLTEDAPLESSPVLAGDLLYTLSDKGVLKCLEAKTGVEHWSERLSGNYGAALLHADNRIYVSNMRGMTTVIQPGRTFRPPRSGSVVDCTIGRRRRSPSLPHLHRDR